MTAESETGNFPNRASPRLSAEQEARIKNREIFFPDIIVLENAVGERRVVQVLGRDASGRVGSMPNGKKGFVVKVAGPQTRQSYALKVCLGDDYPDRGVVDEEVAAAMRLTADVFARPEFGAKLGELDWLPKNVGGWVAFLSPWIEGVTLEHFMAERKPIDPPLVAEIAQQMFNAVLALEQVGLRHDDLHTGNVLLCEVKMPGSQRDAPKRYKEPKTAGRGSHTQAVYGPNELRERVGQTAQCRMAG